MLTGDEAIQVKAADIAQKQAESAVTQAEKGVAQAEVNVTQAEARLAQANSSVPQAQAELDLIDVQMGKLTVYAPVSGVVLTRNIEPGEVIQPAAVALTIGQLDDITITVYVPENRYGQIKMGMEAKVTVDSFPGETFRAAVVRVADQAEFTPRNVQTEEGRSTTVYAIELSVDDPAGNIKPGMPADVAFNIP
jgi:multidrug resistance efflux pump